MNTEKLQNGPRNGQAVVGTIGFFDGVHRGHQCLIEQVRAEASRRGMESLLVSFPQHPAQVLHPEHSVPLLTTTDEKLGLLRQTGVDHVVLVPFTAELAAMSAEEFMRHVLLEQLNVRVLVIGYDHRFGRGRDEQFDDYVRHGRAMGIEVVRASELEGTDHVSSSAVRRALEQGDVAKAGRLLGYDYFLDGRVVSGYGVGHTIGFPTANVQPVGTDKLVPRRGVYAVRVGMPDGACRLGMLNIGRRPTLDNGHDLSIEVNIFDFEGDLYGAAIRLSFVHFVRNEQKFDSVEQLHAQLLHDETTIRALMMHC